MSDEENETLPTYEKDKDAELWYGWDWTKWLESSGQSTIITQCTFIVPAGLSHLADQTQSPLTLIKLGGGIVGEKYNVVYRITTDVGEIDDRTQIIEIVEK